MASTHRRGRIRGALVALLVLGFSTQRSPSEAFAQARVVEHRVDGIAAVVGNIGSTQAILLRSDVDLRARMRLAGRDATGALPLGPLPLDLQVATLDELVGETLIAMEAARVQVGAPSERDVARERARLAALAGGPTRLAELLAALGADAGEVQAAAQRRASVSMFLVANLDASLPSDAEVERMYAAGRHPFVGQPLEAAREPLRALMMQTKLEVAVARWVTMLRDRVAVRIHSDFRAEMP